MIIAYSCSRRIYLKLFELGHFEQSFAGDRDMFLCSVFDGHGPSGHKVAQYIRDHLPQKISSLYNQSLLEGKGGEVEDDHRDDSRNPILATWRARLIKCFHEADEELEADASVESYCSGTTSVTVLKKVGYDMYI